MKLAIPTQLALTLALVALAAPAQGAPIISDGFESYTVGVNVPTSGSPWAETRGRETVRDETTATPFGSTNQYVEISDTVTGNFARLQTSDQTAASAAMTTFSFDLYEPSSGGGDSIQFGYALQGDQLNTGGSRVRFSLDDGTVGSVAGGSNTYSLDTAYRVYVIFNDTASSQTYQGQTIAAQEADVWLQQSGSAAPVYAGSAVATNTQTASYRVGFRTFNGTLQEIWIDNVSLDTGAAITIPEPASLALMGLGSLLIASRRRAA